MKRLAMGLLLAGTVGAGVAMAQGGPPMERRDGPGRDGPGRDGPGREEMERGPGMERGGMEHGRWHGMRRMGPGMGKAAFFSLRKGDAAVNIKCAEDEPMKACVDAAGALLDKLAPAAR